VYQPYLPTFMIYIVRHFDFDCPLKLNSDSLHPMLTKYTPNIQDVIKNQAQKIA